MKNLIIIALVAFILYKFKNRIFAFISSAKEVDNSAKDFDIRVDKQENDIVYYSVFYNGAWKHIGAKAFADQTTDRINVLNDKDFIYTGSDGKKITIKAGDKSIMYVDKK